MARPHIVILQPDPTLARLLQIALREAGYTTDTTSGSAECLGAVAGSHPDLLILQLNTDAALSELLEPLLLDPDSGQVPVVVLTTSSGVAERAANYANVSAALEEPFDIERFEEAVRSALRPPTISSPASK